MSSASSTKHSAPPPWPVILLAGFLIPGGGHFLAGERKRGILIGITILALFAGGVLIGGVRVVEFPDFRGQGTLLSHLLSQPAFLGQFCTGPIALVAGYVSKDLASNPQTAEIIAHSRLWDIAVIYTAVAGALNLLAMIDSTGRVMAEEDPRDGAEAVDQAATQPAATSAAILQPPTQIPPRPRPAASQPGQAEGGTP